MPSPGPHDCSRATPLAALLDRDDVDAALDAGLIDFVPCPGCDGIAGKKIRAAQAKLQAAWAARQRYQARAARLERIATERATRHSPPLAHKTDALPASAATILERAKAKAARRDQQ